MGFSLGGILKGNPIDNLFGSKQKQDTSMSYGFFQSPEQEKLRGQMTDWMGQQLPQTSDALAKMGGYQSMLTPILQDSASMFQNPFGSEAYKKSAGSLTDYLTNQFNTTVMPQIGARSAAMGAFGGTGDQTVRKQAGNDFITTLANALSQLGLQQQTLGATTAENTFANLLRGSMGQEEMRYNPLSQYLKIGQLLPQLQQTGQNTTGMKRDSLFDIGSKLAMMAG